MQNNLTLEIVYQDPSWSALSDKLDRAFETVLSRAMGHDDVINALKGFTASSKLGPEVTLVLANDECVQDLNAQYRGKNTPTNVLSFPLLVDIGTTHQAPEDESLILGDIILAYGTVHAEAEAQEKPFQHHSIHLALHGFLHLLGFDHQTESQARVMERLEIEILHEIGVENPYSQDNYVA